jgi:superfamily II DNA/RNA helicase
MQTPNSRALILAPTLELCAQIKNEADNFADALPQEFAIKTALVIGSGNIKHQIDVIKKEHPALVVGNTKRVLQLAQQKKLHLNTIDFLVLDEVDRLISPELFDETKNILRYLRRDIVYAACSATLSQKNKDALADILGSNFVSTESDEQEILRNNITHLAIWSEARDKIQTLRSFLSVVKPKKALIFTDRAEDVSNIASKLQHHKHNVAALFSGIEKNERKAALDGFRSGAINILVSSDLAARGLDIQNINYVIQLSVPEDSEFYIHRAGRTARAGKKGTMATIGTEVEMRRLLAIEKKLRIKVFPKILYNGQLCAPEDFEDES